MAKMNVNAFLQKDYKNETTFRLQKTNPNKPNFTYPQRSKTEFRCRFSKVRYLSSAFCFLSNSSNDRYRLHLQWHVRHSSRKYRDNLLDLRVLI